MTDPGDKAAKNVLIVGRGTAGLALAEDASRRGQVVVGFLDDSVQAADTLGSLNDVNRVVREHHIDAVYFAIPTIDPKALREFLAGLELTGLSLSMIPRTYSTISRETVQVADLTDVDVLQLVGRMPVKHDLLTAQAFVTGKTAIVTGAAGSIGARLVKHLLELGAERVAAVDISETGLFRLSEHLQDDRLDLIVCDVRSTWRLERVFEQVEPDIVLHAAAYKHVPIMESHPVEALVNNSLATDKVLGLAAAHGVAHAVYVSTDKAVRPANVMGASKRLGEILLTDRAHASPTTKFTAVRFGNVLQSNGSVVETFRRQIQSGGPLTVTHPDVTRYFMTIDEAAQLIIQSALLGETGDICVLDMGEPVRILDLAQSLVRAVAPGLEISFIGLRPGEKMYEELTYDPRNSVATSNEKVFVLRDEEDTLSAAAFEVRDFLRRAEAGYVDDSHARTRLKEMGFALA
jgi:FlaA1/EpsC-like NDP-sugar epimerase